MATWNVRLLSSGTLTEGEGSTIVYYGITDKDETVTLFIRGFRPYFYVQSHPDAVEEVLSFFMTTMPRENAIFERADRMIDGKEVLCTKVSLNYPYNIPKVRDQLKGKGMKLYGADIPYTYRYLFDNDIGSTVEVHGTFDERYAYTERFTTTYAIEVESMRTIEPFPTNLKILSFDIENSIINKTIYCICCAVRDRDGSIRYADFTGKEAAILEDFGMFIQNEDPDVLTGYNIERYDIPHIMERVLENREDLTGFYITRNNSILENRHRSGKGTWKIEGRVVADAWWFVKTQLHPKRETLGFVAKEVLGEEKDDVDAKRIDEEWAADSEKVVRYCRKDAELALRLLEEIRTLPRYMALSTVSKLPLADAMSSGTSTLIDSIMIRAVEADRVPIPMTGSFQKDRQIVGGYVHEVEAGIYKWVGVLDFKSMYPSIIIENNICFSTISPDGTIESPTGTRFVAKDVRQGYVPRILADLMAERDRVKAAMKAAETPEEKNYQDGLQQAVKILMNSFYGVFASAFYRFTNRDIGESITAYARENIKFVIRTLKEEGVDVIYSDTDSVFFTIGKGGSKEECLKTGEGLATRFSRKGVELEFETIYESFFTHGRKKRYVGTKVWPNVDLVIKGYDTQRTDSFDLLGQSQTAIFKMLLDERPDDAIKYAKGVVDGIRRNEFPVDSLVMSKTVKDWRVAGTYSNPDSLPYVTAAKKLYARGYPFFPGMKVPFIVTNGNSTPMDTEPLMEGVENEIRPDLEYYAQRLARSLAHILEPFDWNEKRLLAQGFQKGIFDHSASDGVGKDRNCKDEPCPEDGEDGPGKDVKDDAHDEGPTEEEKAEAKEKAKAAVRSRTTLNDFF